MIATALGGALAKYPVCGCSGDDDLDTYRAVFTDRPFDLEGVDPFLIRATFKTAGGHVLFGGVNIDTTYDKVSLVSFWIDNVDFGFNWQCQEWAKNDLHKLAARLGVDEASSGARHRQ